MMWNTFPLGSKWNEARSSEFEALERGTATTRADRTLSPVVWSPCWRRASSCTWMPRTTVSASYFDDRVQEGAR